MQPPYQLTSEILTLVSAISEKIGEINAAHLHRPPAELRKKNRVRTIHSTLAIEGNTLSQGQVTALFENKRVAGPLKEITEITNAISTYEQLHRFKAKSQASFLLAHRLLLKGLVAQPGKYRSKQAGIVKGRQLAHLAPPAQQVKPLMNALFGWLKKSKEHALISSSVFHYELEFIHPFADGNGRMGRLWQSVILQERHPVFAFLPVESMIRANQAAYYAALASSDKSGHSTPFITFMLKMMRDALEELLAAQNFSPASTDRIAHIAALFPEGMFTRRDYLRRHKNISAATASRDLRLAVEQGLIRKTGDKSRTVYHVVKNP